MGNSQQSADSAPPRLRIAICGIRGIPACYGGFETFAEEIATRLSARGHDVTVYGRRHVITHREPMYRGVKIRLLPALQHKFLETPTHSLLCFLDLLFHPVDVLLLCNAANSPFAWIPRLRRIPTVINVDGVERKRAKWNWVGRSWYWLGEVTSVLFASAIVADAEVIQRYYLEMYRTDSTVIPYGFREAYDGAVRERLRGTVMPLPEHLREELRIEAGRYILYVSRLEPENNAHVVIDAFSALSAAEKQGMKLVIVGDAPYAAEYITRLKARAGEGIVFTGYRFGDDYVALQLSAYLYVQATEVGGTHPALVESMGFGNGVIINDTPENREVLGDAGAVFERNSSPSLAQVFRRLIADPESVHQLRNAARMRAESSYSWSLICSDYETLFYRVTAHDGAKTREKSLTLPDHS